MTSKEDVSIYFTVSDLLNNKQFENFNNKIDLPVYKNIFDANEYIKNNYNEIKDNLNTYNYEFEIINNKIILSNYYMK